MDETWLKHVFYGILTLMFKSFSKHRLILACIAVSIVLYMVISFASQPNVIEGLPPELADIVNTDLDRVTEFALLDHNKDAFTKRNLLGKWSFIIFGYTNCPDVCPTTLLEIDDLAILLKDDSTKNNKIQYIFVSVDPKRDTPDEIKTYLAYFDAGYIGVTGSEAALRQFTDQVGIRFSYVEFTKDEYGVNHSSHMVLIDPKGRYVAHFSAPQYSVDLRDLFAKIKKLKL